MKTLKTCLLLLTLILLNSCADEMDIRSDGRLETDGDSRVSVLHLGSRGIMNFAGLENVGFRLENPRDRVSLSFGGSLKFDKTISVLDSPSALVCRIAIGETDIPDGEYYLTVSGDDLPEIALRRVAFKGNVGREVKAEPMSYDDLEGIGTESDPYLINDDGDFLTLLWYLEDDPDHAYGKYFRQTASFDVPRRSQMIDGRVWLPATFSGIYDGGGNELRNLTYQGASDPAADSGIGLFKELYSATVRNLTFSNALLINTADNVGIIAGSNEGTTLFENITLGGSITSSGGNVGGLTGRSSGSLTLKNITVSSLVVNGSESTGSKVGLLVGSHSGESFQAENVSTPDHIFSVTGHDRVGGIVGDLNLTGSMKLARITLEHSVDAESNTTKVVYGTDKYIGGLIGFVNSTGSGEISGVTVKAPVRGGGDVGALAGHAFVNRLSVSSTILASVVMGNATVGGFFGYLGFGVNDALMTFDSSAGTVRYVVKSSADAGVSGDRYVGGIVGYFDSDRGKMVMNGSVEIAVNVKGREDVGGVFGYASKLADFNPYGVNFSSTTMRVEASENNAGGIVGNVASGSILGTLKIEPVKKLPSAKDMTSCYSGVVTSAGTAGGVAGFCNGTIKGVSSAASVTSTGVDAGGIVGNFKGTLAGCAFTGEVSAAVSGGGIFGIGVGGDVYVSDCVNFADVNAGDHAGGIGGYTRSGIFHNLLITRCYNYGHITGAAAGGIGCYITSENSSVRNSYFDITECGNSGHVEGTGSDDHSVGGIVATMCNNSARVTSCANHGLVSGAAQYAVGGVVGDFGTRSGTNFGKVTQSMNTATVKASVSSTRIGGVVGHLHSGDLRYDSEITDCCNIGELPSDQKDDTGGILGYAANYTNIYRTFNRGKVSHGNAAIGTHHSGSLFHHSNNYYLAGTGKSWPSSTEVSADRVGDWSVYKDFDFVNVWVIHTNGPELRNCPFK